MRINNIFKSIQGEGKYTGYPAVFIRLSGCTRSCDFCDTKYHKQGREIPTSKLVRIIKRFKPKIIVWTGGEPTIQLKGIREVIYKLPDNICNHLETNGDIICCEDFIISHALDNWFDYICVSPKTKKIAKKTYSFINKYPDYKDRLDIKVVTDLDKVGKDMVEYATILMPLTVDYNGPIDKEIERKVWKYCVKNNKRFSLRQHIKVWGNKKGV